MRGERIRVREAKMERKSRESTGVTDPYQKTGVTDKASRSRIATEEFR